VAKAPVSTESLLDSFGPHLAYVPPGGWQDESRNPAERLQQGMIAVLPARNHVRLTNRNQLVGGMIAHHLQLLAEMAVLDAQDPGSDFGVATLRQSAGPDACARAARNAPVSDSNQGIR